MRTILKLILCAFLILSPQIAHSQAAILAAIFGDKVASEKFNLSLELGFPSNNFGNIDNLSSSSGINFGIAGNVKLSDNWYISPTAYFLSKRNANIESYSLNSNDPNLNSLYQNVDANILLSYIDVSTFVYYQPNNSSVRIGFAPQISFRNNATIAYNADIGKFEQDIVPAINKTDFGGILNLGYYFKAGNKGKGIMLNLRYYQGFSDIFNDDLFSGSNKSKYYSVHISLPFITDELASKNLEGN